VRNLYRDSGHVNRKIDLSRTLGARGIGTAGSRRRENAQVFVCRGLRDLKLLGNQLPANSVLDQNDAGHPASSVHSPIPLDRKQRWELRASVAEQELICESVRRRARADRQPQRRRSE